MDQKRNYQKELDVLINRITAQNMKPKLMLHACCAPCSSYVLEYLCEYFSVYILFYNPNIAPEEEYAKRKAELERLVAAANLSESVSFVSCEYGGEAFFRISHGLEQEPEGGKRCLLCYRLRLREAAKKALELGCDYFASTLSISPLKSSEALNRIGEEVGDEYGIDHLPSDFKKKEGYKRSIELSKKYGLYRQDYCGCIYSLKERERLRGN